MSSQRGRTKSVTDEPQTSPDIRDAPMYQLAMLASLSDRKGQAAFANKFGVSLGEWRALAIIAILEPVSLADLSREMRLDKGQLSRTVQRLVQRQWVASRAMPGNRGALMLTLTATGHERYSALMAFALRRNEQSMSILTPSERQAFMHCLRKLRGHVDELFAMETGGQADRQKTIGRKAGASEPIKQED